MLPMENKEFRFLLEEGFLTEEELFEFELLGDELGDDDNPDHRTLACFIDESFMDMENKQNLVSELNNYIDDILVSIKDVNLLKEHVSKFSITLEGMDIFDHKENFSNLVRVQKNLSKDTKIDLMTLSKEEIEVLIEDQNSSLLRRAAEGMKKFIIMIIEFFKSYFTWIGRAKKLIEKYTTSKKISEETFSKKKRKFVNANGIRYSFDYISELMDCLDASSDIIKAVLDGKSDDDRINGLRVKVLKGLIGKHGNLPSGELDKILSNDTNVESQIKKLTSIVTNAKVRTIFGGKETSYKELHITIKDIEKYAQDMLVILNKLETKTKVPFLLKRALNAKNIDVDHGKAIIRESSLVIQYIQRETKILFKILKILMMDSTFKMEKYNPRKGAILPVVMF